MKIIELTKEHEFKLLEMCKKLFPEYPNIWLMRDENFESKYPVPDIVVNFYNDKKDIYIHWFELCMTHLFTKLIVNKYGYESISDAMSNGYHIIHSKNPIDYLYKIFKNETNNS